jgi:hypothetical protein
MHDVIDGLKKDLHHNTTMMQGGWGQAAGAGHRRLPSLNARHQSEFQGLQFRLTGESQDLVD